MLAGSDGALQRLLAGAAIAAVLGLAACGGSDDDGSDATAAGDGSSSNQFTYGETREGDAREQIETTLFYLRERFNSRDGEAFCAKLTASGKAEVLRTGRILGAGRTCPSIMEKVANDAREVTPGGQRPVRVYSISVSGNSATVRLRGGLVGTQIAPLRLRSDGGEWKLIEVGTKKKYPSDQS